MTKEKENTTNITFKYRCYPDKWMQEFIDNNSVAYNLIYNNCVYHQRSKEDNFYNKHGLNDKLIELYTPKIIELYSTPKKLRHKDFDELFYNTGKESGCKFMYLDKGKEFEVIFSDCFDKEILKQVRYAISISKRKIQNDLRIELKDEYKKTYFTRKGEYNRVIESIKNYQEKRETKGKENLYKKYVENVYSGTINYVIDNMNECWQGVYKNNKGKPVIRKNIYDNISFYKYQSIQNPEHVKNNIYRIGISGGGKNKKYLEFVKHRETTGKLASFKIKKNSLGHYYITLLCKLDKKETESLKLQYPKTGLSCGIDVGRNYKATLTNSDKESKFYDNTRNFTYLDLDKKYKDEKLNKILEYNNKEKTRNWSDNDFNKNKEKERISKVLKKLEQARSKIKNIKSRNYLDLTKRINKINENRRLKTKYENHQDSLEIVKNHDVIKMEDLNINSISSGKLAKNKNINNVNLGEFRSMIEYKSKIYDRIFIKVDPKNTTKTCSSCGAINDVERGARLFICNSCGFEKDRDINASINILNSNNILIKKDKKKGKKVVDK
jgi:IS605 OrfB family transposase